MKSNLSFRGSVAFLPIAMVSLISGASMAQPTSEPSPSLAVPIDATTPRQPITVPETDLVLDVPVASGWRTHTASAVACLGDPDACRAAAVFEAEPTSHRLNQAPRSVIDAWLRQSGRLGREYQYVGRGTLEFAGETITFAVVRTSFFGVFAPALRAMDARDVVVAYRPLAQHDVFALVAAREDSIAVARTLLAHTRVRDH